AAPRAGPGFQVDPRLVLRPRPRQLPGALALRRVGQPAGGPHLRRDLLGRLHRYRPRRQPGEDPDRVLAGVPTGPAEHLELDRVLVLRRIGLGHDAARATGWRCHRAGVAGSASTRHANVSTTTPSSSSMCRTVDWNSRTSVLPSCRTTGSGSALSSPMTGGS